MLFEFFVSIFLALLATASGYFSGAAICRMTPGGAAHAFSDLRDYFRPNNDPYTVERRIRQVEILMSSAGIVGIVNLFNACVLAAMLFKSAGINVIWWAVMISLVSVFHLTACLRLQGKTISIETGQRILRSIIINAALFGLMWGGAATIFYAEAEPHIQLLILLALIGTGAAGAAAYSVTPPAALLFSAMIGGQVIGVLLRSGTPSESVAAALAISLLFTMGAMSSGTYGAAIKRPALKAIGRINECAGPSCVSIAEQPTG